MRKLTAFLLIVLVASGASAQVNWFKGSCDEAKALAAKENKLVLLNFFTEGG